MTTFDELQVQTLEIRDAIQSGAIETASNTKLAEYSAWLCHPAIQGHFNGQDYQQVCETVRLQMLRAMIEEFERRGKVMQWWVVALAVAALITSVAQTAIAVRGEMRATQEATSRANAPAAQSQGSVSLPLSRSTSSATQ